MDTQPAKWRAIEIGRCTGAGDAYLKAVTKPGANPGPPLQSLKGGLLMCHNCPFDCPLDLVSEEEISVNTDWLFDEFEYF